MVEINSIGLNQIYVELPVSKEFAHFLRLLVSGIACRMNFDIDAIDDLKIAVEEAYLMALNWYPQKKPLGIYFTTQAESLEILFKQLALSEKENPYQKQQEYGLFIIKAVVDEVETRDSNGGYDLRLTKYLKKRGQDFGGAES